MQIEHETNPDLIEFREQYRAGLREFLQMLPDYPVSADPMTMGIAERTFEDLSKPELGEIESVIKQELKPEQTKLREYLSQAVDEATVPGEIKISVFRTNQPNIYLQELVFADNQKQWVVGANQNI